MNGVISILFFAFVLTEAIGSVTPPIIFGLPAHQARPTRCVCFSIGSGEAPVSLIVSSHGLRLLDTEMSIGSVEALRTAVGRKPGTLT
jgi:hypothetical protein